MAQTIAEGKEAVLKHLETEALKRTGGKPGVYRLERDDTGNVVAVIAGHCFIGSGTISLGGSRLIEADNGILVYVVQNP